MPTDGLLERTLDPDLLDRQTVELLAHSGWSRQRLLAHQQYELKQALRHAVTASPYYAETIGDLVARDAPIHEFPVLTKRLLMENFDRIVTDRRLTRRAVEQHVDGRDAAALLLGEYRAAATGGTTGERGVFIYDDRGWLSVMANIVRFRRMLKVVPSTRSVGIAAASPIHLSYRFYEELRANEPEAPKLDLTMQVPHIVEALNRYQPEVIATYPSFIRVLAKEQAAGRLKISPRILRSGAETLAQDVRELAMETWHAPVINSYSSTEVGLMGQECGEASGVHLAEDICVFEVVDDDNRPVPPGTQGSRFLVTPLTNRVLPLVRYELTDIVTLATGPCRCGSPLARIEMIEGRKEEVLRFSKRDGGHVDVHAGRLRSPLIGTEGVRQFQFAQLPDGVKISIALFPGAEREATRLRVEGMVRGTLEKLEVAAPRIEVNIVDVIERVGAGSKERLVAKA